MVLGTVGKIDERKSENFTIIDKLPTVVDLYGKLSTQDTKKVQGMASCSFEESIQKQDLFINDAVAVQAVNILWKLLKDYQITHHGVIINQATLQQRGIPIKA